MTLTEKVYILVSIGNFGFAAYKKPRKGYGTCELQGYSRKLDSVLAEHGSELCGGCWVVDKTQLYGHPQFARWVADCPLVDTKLGPGQVDRLGDVSNSLVALAVASDAGGYGPIARKQLSDPGWTGLDRIGPHDYAMYWLEKGARVGVWDGSRVNWLSPPRAKKAEQGRLF